MIQGPQKGTRYFYVDESGDSTFFDARGNSIVGQGGCSKHLMLGFICTVDPKAIRVALSDLRARLRGDPYYAGIPLFERTLRSFHAKDDAPEVRHEVFKVLRELPIKAQFIFARKRERTFRNSFRGKQGAFYDHLVSRLFKPNLHLAEENQIYFAKRGSRDRQIPLRTAVDKASAEFLTRYPAGRKTEVFVQCQSPVGEPCLQAADYYLWAVQRLFIRREDRFFKMIEDQVQLVWDLYGEGYPKNVFQRKNPLTLVKISPL